MNINDTVVTNPEIYNSVEFTNFLVGKPTTIYTKNINSVTWADYYKELLNVFIDYIERPELQNSFIKFIFETGDEIELTSAHSLINICMWGFVVNTNQKIEPKHIFFEKDGITASHIKKYIDMYCIIPSRDSENDDKLDMFKLNDTIYKSLRSLRFVDQFSLFFNNTVNIEDFIDMDRYCPEFHKILEKDYSVLSADKMNIEALEDTRKLVELMKNAEQYIGRDHCLADAFRAKVGVKEKQLREFLTNIGVKPNGKGGVFPYPVNTSYIKGGATNLYWYLSEAIIGRQAKILEKKNTADSGAFSRSVMLNCTLSKLYTKPGTSQIDKNYDCHTRNFVKLTIKNEKILSILADRYYRFDPHGMEYRIHNKYQVLKKDSHLIGKTIYLRSPITCASAANGKGICRKCFGDLYNTFIATMLAAYSSSAVTQPLTQMMLSAKHLLEAKIVETVLEATKTDTLQIENVEDYVLLENESIIINPNLQDIKKWNLVINSDDIIYEERFDLNDDDTEGSLDGEEFKDTAPYTTVFYLQNTSTGKTIQIKGFRYETLYFTQGLINISEKYTNDDDNIVIPLKVIESQNIELFEVGIQNDDMTNRLKSITNCLNLKSITESFTKEEFLETLIDRLIDVGIDYVMSVHIEVIIMNQLRDGDNILQYPNWDIENNTNYQILTLKRSIINHPSITVAVQGDNIAKTLITPNSFRRNMPSQFDLLYHVQPLKYIKEEGPSLPIGSVFEYKKPDNK